MLESCFLFSIQVEIILNIYILIHDSSTRSAAASGHAETRSLWRLPSDSGNEEWTVTKTPGTHLIALDLHRCLLWPIENKGVHTHGYNRLKNVPPCASCGSRRNVKWGCDCCSVTFCSTCTRPYELNSAPIEVANPEWKWYRTIITTRICDEDGNPLCKIPNGFRVLAKPIFLRSKRKQKLKSRWEIVSPIKGYVNPLKLAFDHFPFRYLHYLQDQQL